MPADGYIVCNTADPHLLPVLTEVKAKIIDYSKIEAENLVLKFPGAHMVADAKAALAVASAVEIDQSVAVKALNNFSGTWRRFDYKGKTENGAEVYDDYAHHPDEVRATILAAREKTAGKVVVVFQPHMYSRTRDFLPQFAEALALADKVVVVPIYAAREQDDGSTNSSMLMEEITKLGVSASFAPDFGQAADQVKKQSVATDLILVMGAGDITKVSELLITEH
ncbi:MAG: UDP-N-acetylmuramate--alanine ligase [Patescibacteria group bacterium]|nr:UDP-N-acetylmuramate--alanine ligase [Patescibacteria group bacterium]